MKNYNKPSLKFIELRVEESLAGIGSITINLGTDKSIADQVVPDTLANFWLKLLRI